MSDSLLYCSLRKTWVAALPEEKIRQALIKKMTLSLGYPIASLVLEKSLNQLPHLQMRPSIPNRRTDLIVYAKNIHPHHTIYPLLLLECKSIPLTDKTLRQIVGYNQFVGAYFIAAVNQTQQYLGWYHPTKKDFCFQEALPPYDFLLQWARSFHQTVE